MTLAPPSAMAYAEPRGVGLELIGVSIQWEFGIALYMDEDPSKYEFEGSSHWLLECRPISRGLHRMLSDAARIALPRCLDSVPPQPFFETTPPACGAPDLPRACPRPWY